MHTHMVELAPRPGGYVFAQHAPDDLRHTHTIRLKDGSTIQTGPPIGHWPTHAHMLPDGTLTSGPVDGDEAFRNGWLPSIMSSSFGDWNGLGELDMTTVALVGLGIAGVIALAVTRS